MTKIYGIVDISVNILDHLDDKFGVRYRLFSSSSKYNDFVSKKEKVTIMICKGYQGVLWPVSK